jgi:hypothetical protein
MCTFKDVFVCFLEEKHELQSPAQAIAVSACGFQYEMDVCVQDSRSSFRMHTP